MRNALSKAAKVLLVIVTLPIAVIAGLFGSAQKRSADEVADYLRNFIEGLGGEWDWDDFTSVPIADPQLEGIRRRAAAVDLPVTEQGSTTLRGLLAEVEQLGAEA
jgi:hypothetical protein